MDFFIFLKEESRSNSKQDTFLQGFKSAREQRMTMNGKCIIIIIIIIILFEVGN